MPGIGPVVGRFGEGAGWWDWLMEKDEGGRMKDKGGRIKEEGGRRKVMMNT